MKASIVYALLKWKGRCIRILLACCLGGSMHAEAYQVAKAGIARSDLAGWGSMPNAAWGKNPAWDVDRALSTSYADYDSNCGALRASTYYLSTDLTIARLCLDQKNIASILDLGDDRTLTVLGAGMSASIGTTQDASGSSVRHQSGTIYFPASYGDVYPGKTLSTTPRLGIPRNNEACIGFTWYEGGGTNCARLLTPSVFLCGGTNNWVVVTNNGVIATAKTELGSSGTGLRNGIRITDGGVYSNALAGTKSELSVFGGKDAISNRFEVVDGGRLEGFERFNVAAGRHGVFAFRGAATRCEFNVTNASNVCFLNGAGNRLEVTGGAQVTVRSSNNAGRARIWIGTSSNVNNSNGVYVAGQGSKLSFASYGNLVGQYSTRNNYLHVTDGGELIVPNTKVGQGGTLASPACGNWVRVDGGGILRDPSSFVVGYGEPNGTTMFACSNRLDVVDGRAIFLDCTIGSHTNAFDNVMDIGAGGKVDVTGTTSSSGFRIGQWGYGNRLVVHDGGRLSVTNDLTWGQSSNVCASNNVLEVLSGAEVSANTIVAFGRNQSLVVSNAVLRTTGTNQCNGVQFPWFGTADWDMWVTVGGTNPVIRSLSSNSASNESYALGVRRGAHLKFIVPKEGYVEPPLQAPHGRVGFFDNAQGDFPEITFDVSGCGRGLTKTVLAEGCELYVSAGVLAAMRANLRAAVTATFDASTPCSLEATSTRLVLKVGSNGTMFLPR